MSFRVRCLLCCKKFEVKQDDTTALIEHIRECHPEISLAGEESCTNRLSDKSNISVTNQKKNSFCAPEEQVSEVSSQNLKEDFQECEDYSIISKTNLKSHSNTSIQSQAKNPCPVPEKKCLSVQDLEKNTNKAKCEELRSDARKVAEEIEKRRCSQPSLKEIVSLQETHDDLPNTGWNCCGYNAKRKNKSKNDEKINSPQQDEGKELGQTKNPCPVPEKRSLEKDMNRAKCEELRSDVRKATEEIEKRRCSQLSLKEIVSLQETHDDLPKKSWNCCGYKPTIKSINEYKKKSLQQDEGKDLGPSHPSNPPIPESRNSVLLEIESLRRRSLKRSSSQSIQSQYQINKTGEEHRIGCPRPCMCEPKGNESQISHRQKYKIKDKLRYSPSMKSKMFRTSIERWKPGKTTVVCPKCGANKRPLIRIQSDKVSYTPLGAACILTCWPFCFLPCLFPPPSKEYLHCAVCNHLLGVYDRKAEVIQPNEEECRKPPDENIMPEGRTSNVKR